MSVHQRSEDLDVHAHSVLLDGNRGHEVLLFVGNRLSMVAFTGQVHSSLNRAQVGKLRVGAGTSSDNGTHAVRNIGPLRLW
jgi:hypothetical protein